MRVRQHSRENPALYGIACPACDMPSFAPCLHEEADTRIFARATEAAKQENKQLLCFYCYSSSGHTCCEWMNCGVGKNRPLSLV